ncbi:preprotein translocase subunit SecE [Hyphococcus sp.]|jgi:preprotein translocase subunit SecE|uniref:preprotein translocase subunit SecE n=1 Tax=Hyphococcus sp. TaxID=2038636 RepID=UPI003D0A87D5
MAKKKKPAGGPDVIEGKATEVKKKKRTSPLEFIQQVRNEAAKVTWTTRNETLVSTVMVLIMVAIMALFFFGVDQGLRFAVCHVLPIDCVGANN